jgi:ABC-type multidrug transport system fused ATPase/permease subunit
LALGAGRPESSSESSVTYFSLAAAAPYAGIITFLYLFGLSFLASFDLRLALPLGFLLSILALYLITVKQYLLLNKKYMKHLLVYIIASISQIRHSAIEIVGHYAVVNVFHETYVDQNFTDIGNNV